MKHSYLYAGLLGAALLTGCHRNDAERISYDLSGTYRAATTLAAAQPIAMYTKAGQVSDPAVVTRFIARRTWLKGYFSATDEPLTGSYTNTLTFRANHRATLVSASPARTDSVRFEVTDEQPQSFRLQELDSVTTIVSTLPGPGPACTRTPELSDYIRSAYPGKRCVPVALTVGNGELRCRTRLVRVVGAHGSQLYRPYYSWVAQGGGGSLAYGGERNTFNPAVLNHLVAGDTIVVQEREIALTR